MDNKINVTIEQLGSLIAVHAKEKKAALILIPPLWHEKQGLIENIEAVNSALSMLKADFGPDVMPIWTDIRDFARRPMSFLQTLYNR